MEPALHGATHWQQNRYMSPIEQATGHRPHWDTDDGYREIDIGALRINPGRDVNNDDKNDDDDGEDGEEEEQFMEEASSMSSSPSIPDENINFDLVYALHTFVATVEGQASVVKGDALILMEDTNIYWWLVEVLKTREVGYIPAENIETPYERLARLNKHRNVEITSPSADNADAYQPYPTAAKPTKSVTIAGATQVIHYEPESEDEYDMDKEDNDDNNSTADEEEFEDAHDTVSEEIQIERDESVQQQDASEPRTAEANAPVEVLEELRVFAGNIGQSPLFHTFSISLSTTAEELVKHAVSRFGLRHPTSLEPDERTVEHYIAVQGLDGDDYVLAPQDKPLSIFKTLTAPLTTPMPSVTHIKRISSQQNLNEAGTTGASTTRRTRSSSFSNYEQTSYDEDSVIRFYLHRRIKSAHEREGMIYIKVCLYPDEGVNAANGGGGGAGDDDADDTRAVKKKKAVSSRTEIDRIDKIIAVKKEHQIGAIINMALEKFHVPDAEAEGYNPTSQGHHQHPLSVETNYPDRQFTKYGMSVRANGKETVLDPRDHMATVLHQQQQYSAQGPITGDLLFVLRRADTMYHHQTRRAAATAPLLSPVDIHHNRASPHPEERRPSILDILMDSPRPGDSRRPSAMTMPTRFMDDRRPSAPSSIHSAPERKTSLTPPSPMGLQSPSSSSLTAPTAGFRRTSVMSTSNISTVSSMYSDNGAWDESGSGMARSASMQPGAALNTESPRKKKENSFREQLKRLVGWGSKSKKTAAPPPLVSAEENPSHQQTTIMQQNLSSISVQTPPTFAEQSASSQVSVASAPPMSMPPISAPPTPLTPSPSSNKTVHPKLTTQNLAAKPDTPIIEKRETFNPPFSPIQQRAPTTTVTSTVEDTVSHCSPSVASISSVDDDDEDIQGIEVSDDSEDEQEQPTTTAAALAAANIQKHGSMNDIQAQYAMWMDSQQGTIAATESYHHPTQNNVADRSSNEEPALQSEPDQANLSMSPSSTSTVSSTTQSSLASAAAATTTPSANAAAAAAAVAAAHPHPHETVHSEKVLVTDPPPTTFTKPSEKAPSDMMDDLYLLVTRGVDYLQSRESSKWDDDGGYDFHPWNRPDGSFAVRKKKQDAAAASERPVVTEILSEALSGTNEQSEQEQQEQSTETQTGGPEVPSTPESPKPHDGETKRTNSLSNKNTPPRTAVNRHPVVQPSTQNEALIDEQELQRIVASHIVF